MQGVKFPVDKMPARPSKRRGKSDRAGCMAVNETFTVVEVVLDDLTIARLIELADMLHADPATIVASIVRDVLEDDARMHAAENRPPQGVTLQ